MTGTKPFLLFFIGIKRLPCWYPGSCVLRIVRYPNPLRKWRPQSSPIFRNHALLTFWTSDGFPLFPFHSLLKMLFKFKQSLIKNFFLYWKGFYTHLVYHLVSNIARNEVSSTYVSYCNPGLYSTANITKSLICSKHLILSECLLYQGHTPFQVTWFDFLHDLILA